MVSVLVQIQRQRHRPYQMLLKLPGARVLRPTHEDVLAHPLRKSCLAGRERQPRAAADAAQLDALVSPRAGSQASVEALSPRHCLRSGSERGHGASVGSPNHHPQAGALVRCRRTEGTYCRAERSRWYPTATGAHGSTSRKRRGTMEPGTPLRILRPSTTAWSASGCRWSQRIPWNVDYAR
jgi:hypothetical protein